MIGKRWPIVASLVGGIVILGGLAVSGPWISAGWKAMGNRFHLKPTYPSDQVADSLKRLMANEYNLNVETRLQEGTLQAFFWKAGLMTKTQTEMSTDAAESMERVLLCATRVALSTDAPLKFIEVKMADIFTGATVTLWRYVPDIRDSMYTRLAEDEYINRLVIEMDLQAGRMLEGRVPRWDRPITMAEFLAKQVVLRAKRQSPVGIQAHEDLSKPLTLVVVIENWSSIEEQGEHEREKVQESIEKAANSVLKGYRFDGFRGVIVQDARGLALKTWKL